MNTMMNFKKNTWLLVTLTGLLVCAGCSPAGSDNDANPEETYSIIEIEGHEYIFISRRPWSGEIAMAHKANCKAH